MRDLDQLQRIAAGHGPADRCLRDGAARAPAAVDGRCGRSTRCSGWSKSGAPARSRGPAASALEHEAVNVALIGRMLERGPEQTPIQPPLPRRQPRHRDGDQDGRGGPVRPRSRRVRDPPRQRECPVSPTAASGPVTVSPELKTLLRQVKLGRSLDTLPGTARAGPGPHR